jgi:preprotein translocase subunit YajC
MSKINLLFAGVIALILVASVAGAALAASGDEMPGVFNGAGGPGGPGRGDRVGHLRGEITAISDEEFTLETEEGEQYTFMVDDETRYFGDLESFEDLEVGLSVGVAVMRNGEDTALAKAVGAGDIVDATRAHGEITDIGADSLTIETRDGDTLTFVVDGDTQFASRDGSVTSLDDLEVGDHAMVAYEADGADLIALVVGSGGPQGGRPQGAPNGQQG